MQPVLSKILSSLIRNRIYTYLVENGYIETNIQKGFWNKLSGVIAHTELLTHMINHARLKQRQLILTLLDLKNAFGEVDHRFLKKILYYHNIPVEIINIIFAYYNDYFVSIGTKDFTTHPISVKRGVLQGDCLSPLLFNMCMNSLIKCTIL